MKPTRMIVLSVVALAALTLGPVVESLAALELELPVNMRGNAGAQTRGRTTMVDISITEWTSAEERQMLIDYLKAEGSRNLDTKMQDLSSKGRINPRGQMGVNFRYAYQFPKEGGVTIVLATDRPVNAGEAAAGQGVMARAHNISMAVIELDEKGKGAGTLILGAELKFGADGRLEVTGAGQNPIHLGGVRVLK